MNIQKCKKCETRFKYIDILDSSGWGYKPIICRSCGAKYILNMKYIVIIAIMLSLPLFFIGKVCTMLTTIKLKVLLGTAYIIYMAVIVGLYPFIVRYRLKEDEI